MGTPKTGLSNENVSGKDFGSRREKDLNQEKVHFALREELVMGKKERAKSVAETEESRA